MINKIQIIIFKIFMTSVVMLCCNDNCFAEEKHIVLATTNYEPYYASTLPDGGYFTEITREAFRRVGYTLEIQWYPWKRAIITAKTGEAHGVLGIAYTEERIKYFSYSDIIDTDYYVFFASKGHSISYKGVLSDLKPYVIGIYNGSMVAKDLKNAGLKKLDNVTRDEQNIKKLLRGRIDCFPGSKRAMLYYINKKHPENKHDIVMLEPPYKAFPYYITISKKIPDHAIIIRDFNKGLEQIKKDGTFEKILKKHGIIN